MSTEIHRIIDSNGNQMDSDGYPTQHVYLNKTKCKRNVARLNATSYSTNKFTSPYSGVPPFEMQTATLEWITDGID